MGEILQLHGKTTTQILTEATDANLKYAIVVGLKPDGTLHMEGSGNMTLAEMSWLTVSMNASLHKLMYS